jgi:hypothetical protein
MKLSLNSVLRVIWACKIIWARRLGENSMQGQDLCCRIISFHGGDYEECCRLKYKNPVRTSQKTYYVSATETSWLTICKTWGFNGCVYEECRLLGYKTPMCTSQETHYFSAKEPGRLILCKNWGFHDGNYDECCVFWDVMPCGSCYNRHFVGTYSFHHQGGEFQRAKNNVITPNVVTSWMILSILETEAKTFSEILVLTRSTWCFVPDDGILQSYWHLPPRPDWLCDLPHIQSKS